MPSAPTLTIVANNPDLVGECPIWDPTQRALLWTDNRSQRLYRHTPATGAIDTIVDGLAVYAFTLQRDGSLLLFLNNTRIALARAGHIETIVDGLPGEEDTRFNDILVDSAGRIICGVLPSESGRPGSLYSLTPDATPTKIHDGMQLPNGMAFSPDERLLYVADTRARHVLAFDYDIAAGAATAPRTFVDFASDPSGAGQSGPDGITVDSEGSLWVAVPGSSAISRYAPDGALLQRVPLPAIKPTSVGFGGDDMATLFITTASRQTTPNEDLGPQAGALLAYAPTVPGLPDHRTNWRA